MSVATQPHPTDVAAPTTTNGGNNSDHTSNNDDRYVMVRTKEAGCFFGLLMGQRPTSAGMIVDLSKARRIWFWSGAASLSELAVEGTIKPTECKFPVGVPKIQLIGAIEILDLTDKARKSLEVVPIWSAKNQS